MSLPNSARLRRRKVGNAKIWFGKRHPRRKVIDLTSSQEFHKGGHYFGLVLRNRPKHAMSTSLRDQHATIRKKWRGVEGVLDRCRSVPIAFGENHWDAADDIGAEFITHVGAGPDLGSCHIRIPVPMSEQLHGGIGS